MMSKHTFLTTGELEKKIADCKGERQRILYRLNGESPLCSTPKCGFSSPDRNQFRFKSSHSDGKKKVFIFCTACAGALEKVYGVETAPYGVILRDDLKKIEEDLQIFQDQLKTRLEKEKIQSEKAKLFADCGNDFLTALGIKKVEEQPLAITENVSYAKEERSPVKPPTNAQKKRGRRAATNGAAPAEPTTTTEEQVTH